MTLKEFMRETFSWRFRVQCQVSYWWYWVVGRLSKTTVTEEE